MALPVVIAKNQTGTPILLPRLGVTCPASPGTIVLTDEANFFEVASEEILEQRVAAGDIVINDGTVDLDAKHALAYLDATGNMNGPIGALVDETLVKLDGSTGRYTKSTGIAVDTSNNLTNVGTINGVPNIAQYRNTGSQTISTSATTLTFNATDYEDSNYTRSGSSIRFNVAGIYKVSYTINWDTTNRNRRTLTAWAEMNGVEIVPSRSNDYARNSTDDTGSNTAVFFTEPTLNQKLTLVGQSTGTSGSLGTLGNQVWVTLEYVRAS